MSERDRSNCVFPERPTCGECTLCKNRALTEEVNSLRERKDEAYFERNQCVALIVRMAIQLGLNAGVGVHEDKPGEDWDPEWRTIVCIDLPTGQVSWHLHDSQKHLVEGLPTYLGGWDGHDTPEKYRRVNAAFK